MRKTLATLLILILSLTSLYAKTQSGSFTVYGILETAPAEVYTNLEIIASTGEINKGAHIPLSIDIVGTKTHIFTWHYYGKYRHTGNLNLRFILEPLKNTQNGQTLPYTAYFSTAETYFSIASTGSQYVGPTDTVTLNYSEVKIDALTFINVGYRLGSGMTNAIQWNRTGDFSILIDSDDYNAIDHGTFSTTITVTVTET